MDENSSYAVWQEHFSKDKKFLYGLFLGRFVASNFIGACKKAICKKYGCDESFNVVTIDGMVRYKDTFLFESEKDLKAFNNQL